MQKKFRSHSLKTWTNNYKLRYEYLKKSFEDSFFLEISNFVFQAVLDVFPSLTV